MKKKSTSKFKKSINVLDKHGKFVARITKEKATFSVKRHKSIWVNDTTIQLCFHWKDMHRLKREVWERDHYICFYCGHVLHATHAELTVDHVIPQRLGGSVLPENMVCSCRSCNEEKGYRKFTQYFYGKYAVMLYLFMQYRLNYDSKGEWICPLWNYQSDIKSSEGD